jgi:hypothetical protein
MGLRGMNGRSYAKMHGHVGLYYWWKLRLGWDEQQFWNGFSGARRCSLYFTQALQNGTIGNSDISTGLKSHSLNLTHPCGALRSVSEATASFYI